jgi:hypothetical protein
MSSRKAYLGIILALSVGAKEKKKWRWMKEWFKNRHVRVFSHENSLKELEVNQKTVANFRAWMFQLMMYYKWLLP